MNDTHVTIRGWIGGEPRMFSNRTNGSGTDSNRATTIFRVGVTPRYFSRHDNQFTDGVTTWYSVRCYGALATNASLSLKKGMPVIVRGRLTTRLWIDKSGEQQREMSIIADSVGVELSSGIASYGKRSDAVVQPQPGEPGWTGESENATPAQGWNGTGADGGDQLPDDDAGETGQDGVVDEDGVVLDDADPADLDDLQESDYDEEERALVDA